MKKRTLLITIHKLLTPEKPHTMKIFIHGPEPLRLYKEVPHDRDLTVIAVNEETAETLLSIYKHL
jgi:hypothetical protein